MSNTASKWTVAEAKARFSELIDRARTAGPQTITRSGKTAVVVVSPEEWARKTRRKGNLSAFLASAPLAGVELSLERIHDAPRRLR